MIQPPKMEYSYPIVWSAQILNHMSKTSKLDDVYSWSLQARATCPGSIKIVDGVKCLVDVCKGCYASYGCYRFKSTVNVRKDNNLAWQCEDWIEVMVKNLSKKKKFRWFDSGDVYCEELAWKIYEVMKLTPETKHWLPSRMYKFEDVRKVLELMKELPNVSVRYSSDEIDGSFIDGLHGSAVYSDEKQTTEKGFKCPATLTGGKCSGCDACYDPKIKLIYYRSHGREMNKLVKQKT